MPSTARKVISVGAYDSRSRIYASFSGRGNPPGAYPLPALSQVKPDLVAPGVDIQTAAVGGGYISVTGTSFATPFVSGAAAMLMEWGLVDGNDPYLHGEKVRAYLQRGAQRRPGYGSGQSKCGVWSIMYSTKYPAGVAENIAHVLNTKK